MLGCMDPLPSLDLFVADDCRSCRRAAETLAACEELRKLVSIRVVNIDSDGAEPPPRLVGVPTLMFKGTVLALGTPDCAKLVLTVRALLSATA